MRIVAVSALVFLVACPTSTGSTAHVAEDTDDNSNDDSGGNDTGEAPDYLEVAALGFEYVGGWDQELGMLENFVYRDSNGDPQASGNFVRVTLASLHYFDLSSDDPGLDEEYCEFIASFYYGEAEFTGTAFDWDAGAGGTGEELETWSAFEGYLRVEPDTFSDRCTELDPEVFEDGDPTITLDHMHFGLGFGPLSPYLTEQYQDGEDFAEYEDAYMTQYIAINHPDGSGGYTFDAYDWNGALLVETDYDSCVDVDDGNGGTFEVCGEYLLTEDSYYVPGDTTIPPRHGFVSGFSSWLEDTPNLDLTLLQDGTEAM